MFTRRDELPAFEGADGVERAEAGLVARVADRELDAFEALYRIYHPRLTRFLERVTRRPGLVEELLNDTMLVVWNRAATYNGNSKVSTWIFAIAYRKALKATLPLDVRALVERQSQGAQRNHDEVRGLRDTFANS